MKMSKFSGISCMMTYACLLAFGASCTNQDVAEEVVLTRAIVDASDSDDPLSLADGATLLLHCMEGTSGGDQTITFSNGSMKAQGVCSWDDHAEYGHIVALSPAFEQYDEPTLYDDEGYLVDLLYQDARFPAFQSINCVLSHRFSRLNLELDEVLLDGIFSLSLEVSPVVTGVSLSSVGLALDDTRSVTTSREVNGSSVYQFIVPSDCTPAITLNVLYKDGTTMTGTLDRVYFEPSGQYSSKIHKGSEATRACGAELIIGEVKKFI